MKESDLIRKAMSALGSRTSEAKSAAAKTNGKKGGRPKKVMPNKSAAETNK